MFECYLHTSSSWLAENELDIKPSSRLRLDEIFCEKRTTPKSCEAAQTKVCPYRDFIPRHLVVKLASNLKKTLAMTCFFAALNEHLTVVRAGPMLDLC